MNETQETPEVQADCLCGCQQETSSGSKYRQGHDARHAGAVARRAARLAVEGDRDYIDDGLYEELPTQALRAKARRTAERMVSKNASKSERKAAKASGFGNKDGDRTGYVRIGRWDYPARKNGRGEVVRNTKRDGSGTWAPADPGKFNAI